VGAAGAAANLSLAAPLVPKILSGMIRAVVVDPQPQPRHRLGHLLAATGLVEVIDTVAGGIPAVEAIGRLDPDVVFIHLSPPGGKGLDVAEAVGSKTLVVLVATTDAHALAGFRVGAVDYMLEPLDLARITATLVRLDRLLARPHDAAASSGADAPPSPAGNDRSLPVFDPAAAPLALEDRIPITSSETRITEYVSVGRIAWVESLENFSRVQLSGGARLVLKRSLSAWEEILPVPAFRRLGRSLIIQDGRIKSASWKGRNAHVLFEGVPHPLIVGRAAADRLRKLLKPRDGR